ncbi:MAG: bifunctional methylenetetrahydrofolate dehydrogenase/methenyltetrahydrofolate cyclohydrolase FolD [Clostridia bacterium]|nr:bifunctional methylenetetrahydrofolate dehydrogenase/methenyltetrahydrofolate cyclohydrolase FolD [Clostridia bacterium]
MSAILLDGKQLSRELEAQCTERVQRLKEQGIIPGLAFILVGEDPASVVYVRSKNKACERCGIRSVTLRLPESISQEELEQELNKLAGDESIHGMLLQLPIPKHLDEAAAIACIPPEKDVDGFHQMNAGSLVIGTDGMRACSPLGIMDLLALSGVDPCGKHAVVIGRSAIVGKPAALLLLEANCTVTICHSKTENLASYTRQADILVSAVGKAGLITGDMVKPGAVVIDAGIARVEGKVTGDIERGSVEQVAGYLSPVPGGCGPMTIAELMVNTVSIAEKKAHV